MEYFFRLASFVVSQFCVFTTMINLLASSCVSTLSVAAVCTIKITFGVAQLLKKQTRAEAVVGGGMCSEPSVFVLLDV